MAHGSFGVAFTGLSEKQRNDFIHLIWQKIQWLWPRSPRNI